MSAICQNQRTKGTIVDVGLMCYHHSVKCSHFIFFLLQRIWNINKYYTSAPSRPVPAATSRILAVGLVSLEKFLAIARAAHSGPV